MLQNAYLLAKIGADTAENEQQFAEILPIGRRVVAEGIQKNVRESVGEWREQHESRCAGEYFKK